MACLPLVRVGPISSRAVSRLVVVAGGGGFIGGHLVRSLLASGATVRAVDLKPPGEWHQRFEAAHNRQLDLRTLAGCREALRDADEVYNLASDMGGMGFIERNRALCMLSVLINTHLLMAAREQGVSRYFFASSACVYPVTLQTRPDVTPLAEDDAYPAQPEDGYGWEKLYGERLCRTFFEDFGLATRVARYHNVYGPFGAWTGGREKAPSAICRKVAEAKLSGRHEIEIWGTGRQTRSFLWIDDCIEGTRALTGSDVSEPVNVGSEELVTIDDLVTIVEDLAGLRLERRYQTSAPQGVMGRNSDNTRIRRTLGWSPTTPLRKGLAQTWSWVYEQVEAQQRRERPTAILDLGARSPSAVDIRGGGDKAPDLSIVVTSRNDEHGGDIGRRLRFFINALLHQTRRVGLSAELLVVEWNPPEGAPRLHEALPRPSAGDSLRIRTVTVPREVHGRFRHGDAIPLYQMIAKNVGIRRAHADWVLCTNVDLLFSDALADFLARGPRDSRAFYRANRCDVPDELDPGWSVPAQLEFCANHILRRLGGPQPAEEAEERGIPSPRGSEQPPDPRFSHIQPAPRNPNWRYAAYLQVINLLLRGAEMGNRQFQNAVRIALGGAPPKPVPADAPPPPDPELPPEEVAYRTLDLDACGDFTLMSKAAWLDIQGYVELDLYSIYVDSLAVCGAVALGYEQVVLPAEACAYHLDHPAGWSSLAGIERLRFLERRPGLDYQTFRQVALELLRGRRRIDMNSPTWGLLDEHLEENTL